MLLFQRDFQCFSQTLRHLLQKRQGGIIASAFKPGNISLRRSHTLSQFLLGHASRPTAFDFSADNFVLGAKRIVLLLDFGTLCKDFGLILLKIHFKYLIQSMQGSMIKVIVYIYYRSLILLCCA